MNNHGNYIVSMGNVDGLQSSQELGVEIFPGMACSELVFGETGEVKGVVAGEFGKIPMAPGWIRTGYGASWQICIPVRRRARVAVKTGFDKIRSCQIG